MRPSAQNQLEATAAPAASPSDHLAVERSERSDGAVVLSLVGELDIESARMLASALGDPENAQAAHIVLDLSGLEFIDSTGIAALMQARIQARQGNRELALANLSAAAARLFDITGITSQFTIT